MELKYKAYNKTRNVMFYQGVHFNDLILVEGEFKPGLNRLVENNHNWYKEEYEILPYTGAKDINKEEIYKGDICKDDAGTILEIVWQEDKYQYGAKVIKGCTLSQGLTFPLWQWNECKENGYRRLERIGNIYTEPDMIKKE